MTEAEWLTSDDPSAMTEFIRERASERKLQLFAVHTFRQLVHYLPHDLPQEIDLLEGLAERTAALHPERERVRASRRIRGWPFVSDRGPDTDHDDDYNFVAILLYREQLSSLPASHAIAAASGVADSLVQRPKQVVFLRDIFGNPFRTVVFSPDWRTDTAVTLAQQMYEARDFALVPILADALQDAGCDNSDVLDHCRGPSPHVRGCWVVDSVLGKG